MALRSRLLDFAAGLSQAVDDGVAETAEQVYAESQADVPVDTGQLKASGVVAGTAGSGVRTVSYGRGLPDSRAIYQEYGTDKAPAQPYLTPAAARANLTGNIGKQLQALVEQCRI